MKYLNHKIHNCPLLMENGQCFQLGSTCIFMNPEHCNIYQKVKYQIKLHKNYQKNLELREAQRRSSEMYQGINKYVGVEDERR